MLIAFGMLIECLIELLRLIIYLFMRPIRSPAATEHTSDAGRPAERPIYSKQNGAPVIIVAS